MQLSFFSTTKKIIIIRARNKVAFKTEQMEHLEHPANFLTRNNKIFCPQLSRQNIFNMVHLDDLPKICDFSSEFFKNSCPKFLTCQSGTPRTVYFRIHDVAGITPNGLFFNDTSKTLNLGDGAIGAIGDALNTTFLFSQQKKIII